MRIRLAREEEIALLPEIEESAAGIFAAHGLARPEHTEAAPAENWREPFDQQLLWVAVDGDETPVGFLAGHLHEDVFYIAELDVHQDHQGQGVGRRLMGVAEEAARGLGKAEMALTTFDNVPWNKAFYESLGFHVPDPMPDWLAGLLEIEREKGLANRCGMILKL